MPVTVSASMSRTCWPRADLERRGEVGRDGRLADAALGVEDGDDRSRGRASRSRRGRRPWRIGPLPSSTVWARMHIASTRQRSDSARYGRVKYSSSSSASRGCRRAVEGARRDDHRAPGSPPAVVEELVVLERLVEVGLAVEDRRRRCRGGGPGAPRAGRRVDARRREAGARQLGETGSARRRKREDDGGSGHDGPLGRSTVRPRASGSRAATLTTPSPVGRHAGAEAGQGRDDVLRSTSASWLTVKTNSPSGPEVTPTDCTPATRPRWRLKPAMLATLTRPMTTTCVVRVDSARRLARRHEAGEAGGERLVGDRRDLLALASSGAAGLGLGGRAVSASASAAAKSRARAPSVAIARVAGLGRSPRRLSAALVGTRPRRVVAAGRLGLVSARRRLGGCLGCRRRLGGRPSAVRGLGRSVSTARRLAARPGASARRLAVGSTARRPLRRRRLLERRRLGHLSAIAAKLAGSSSASRRSKKAAISASNAATRRLDVLDRALDRRGVPLELGSSVGLRAAIRSSVSSRMRAISAFDQSRMPATSSSASRRSSVDLVGGARVDALDGGLGLGPKRSRVSSRAASAARMAGRGRPGTCVGLADRGGRRGVGGRGRRRRRSATGLAERLGSSARQGRGRRSLRSVVRGAGGGAASIMAGGRRSPRWR